MKKMKRILKSICIAFSMFSKIPVPQFKWQEEDMRNILLFFPMVGIVIGGVTYLWGMICDLMHISKACFVLVGTAIPLLISGGIHVDGYMDTMDALHSYQSKEKKLEILKDPHLGAFAVIQIILYYLLYIGAYAELEGKNAILLLGCSFWLSRILSGIGSVWFHCAKQEGLVFLFSSRSQKRIVKNLLWVQLVICSFLLLYISGFLGGAILFMSTLTLGYYWWKCRKEFGGITGDTAGYFTTLCEGVIIVTIATGSILNLI